LLQQMMHPRTRLSKTVRHSETNGSLHGSDEWCKVTSQHQPAIRSSTIHAVRLTTVFFEYFSGRHSIFCLKEQRFGKSTPSGGV
jgi:hypothetical protein